jgi:hypothetical protein
MRHSSNQQYRRDDGDVPVRSQNPDGAYLWWQGSKTSDNREMVALEEREMVGIEDVQCGHASASASSIC